MKSHDLERAFQVSVFFLNAKRASVFKPRMKSVISSTPAHASFCHCAYGLIANWKIVTGSVAIGWRRSALKKWLDNTVNNSGAVSPEMRATDSKHPVTMPLAAALSAIAPIIFHFGAPSANAASRNASGTSLSIFSVVRTIIGICMQIPMIVRTTENMLRLVPDALREAAFALGAPKWKMIGAIALKAAASGIVTGCLLSVARISGETAPLLFTVLSNHFFSADLRQPMATLPVTIFQFAMSPYAQWQKLAWAGVLLMTLFILGLNTLARLAFRKKTDT